MARQYRLTWLQDSRRWRKRYKGRYLHFPLLPGESKDSSYGRCWDAWIAKRAEIDQTVALNNVHAIHWQQMLTALMLMQERFKNPALLEEWIILARQRLAGDGKRPYQYAEAAGVWWRSRPEASGTRSSSRWIRSSRSPS